MRIAKTLLPVLLIALTIGCGYGSNYNSSSGTTTPAIAQLSPNATTAGGTAFTLTVMGTNFSSKTVVNWNSTSLTTTYMSGTELTASVPASDIAASGTAQITVATPTSSSGGSPWGGSGSSGWVTSTPMSFTISE
jgi:hypothetical protein